MSSVGGHPRDPNGDELPDFTAPEHAAAVQARTALGLSAHQAVLLLEGEWWRAHNAARRAWKEFRDAEEAHELPEEREGRARPGDAQQPEQARCVDARNSSATVYSTARECCSPSSLRHGVMQDPGLPPPELLANTSGATRLVYAHVVDSSCVPFFLKKHPTAPTTKILSLIISYSMGSLDWSYTKVPRFYRVPQDKPFVSSGDPATDFKAIYMHPHYIIYVEYIWHRGQWKRRHNCLEPDGHLGAADPKNLAEFREALGLLDRPPQWYSAVR